MANPAVECLEKAYVKLRYIPPPGGGQEPADCTQVQFNGDPDIMMPPQGMRRLDGLPTEELVGIELLCDALSLEGEGAIILIFQVATYIRWWASFLTKQMEYVTELHKVYVSIPVMVKIPGSHILLSRWMPMWMRIGHYLEAIWAAFRKIDEIDETLGKFTQLKKGLCPVDIMILKKSLQLIEQKANEALRDAKRAANGGVEPIAMLMRGRRPFYAQLAGISRRSPTSVG